MDISDMISASRSYFFASLAHWDRLAVLGDYNPLMVLIWLIVLMSLAALHRADLQQILTLYVGVDLGRSRPWSFVSYNFIHADFWHLFGNISVLWMLARQFNKQNSVVACVIWLASGIIAGILGVLTQSKQAQSVVGASAGVFGVLAFALYASPRLIIHLPLLPPLSLGIWFAAVMAGSLICCVFGLYTRVWHIGHVLGGVVGILLTWFLYPKFISMMVVRYFG